MPPVLTEKAVLPENPAGLDGKNFCAVLKAMAG
jgi:hypothetical protein